MTAVGEAVPQTVVIRRCDGLHEPLHRSGTLGMSALEEQLSVEEIWLQTVETSVSHLVQACHSHNSIKTTPVCIILGAQYTACAA